MRYCTYSDQKSKQFYIIAYDKHLTVDIEIVLWKIRNILITFIRIYERIINVRIL